MGKISKIRNVLCSAFAVCFLAAASSPAFFADGGRQVVPIGSAVEITLDTQGVIVAGYPPESPGGGNSAGGYYNGGERHVCLLSGGHDGLC